MLPSIGRYASGAPRRWSQALALLVVFGVLNLLSLRQLRSPQSSDGTVAAGAEGCATMDKWHLDPLFASQAQCITQEQVVNVLRQLVVTAAQLFETHNITYFLDSGTLLGAYRDQRVISYDSDADVAIDVAGFDFIREHRVEVPDHFFLAVYASGDLYPGSMRDKEIPIRLTHRVTALYVDVFVFSSRGPDATTELEMVGPQPSWSFDRCISCRSYYNQGKQLLVPREWIYPTVRCEFEGKWLQCPQQADKYLRYMFGADYMIPIKY